MIVSLGWPVVKILQYNILDGCMNDPTRLAKLGDWLTNQEFDLVGLNELNGWNTSTDISMLGPEWGYPHHALFETKTSPYFVGVLSRHPIHHIAGYEEGFHHGALILKTFDIHVVVTHLTPICSRHREAEAARLVEIIDRLKGPVLLMGDLNTLSPRDQDRHSISGLVEILRRDAHLTRKFLDAEAKINYRPMQRLLDAGLTDLSRRSDTTVPTEINVDAAHASPMRLDYIMANQCFLAGRTPVAEALHETPLPYLSDHFPVMCTW